MINFNHSNSTVELRLSDVAMAAEPKRDGGKFEMEPEENDEQSKPASIDRLVLFIFYLFMFLFILFSISPGLPIQQKLVCHGALKLIHHNYRQLKILNTIKEA